MKRLLLQASLLLLICTAVINAQVLTPANNATGVSQLPTYTWTVTTNPYTVQVYSDALMTTLVYQATGLTSASYTPATPLTANTQYWWQVTDGLAATFTGTFFTNFLSSPAHTITGVPLRPRLDWLLVTGATGYTVTVSTSNTFPVGPNTFTMTTSTNYAIVPEDKILTGSTTYYWKVDCIGVTNTSATWYFSTAPLVTFTVNFPADASTVYNLTPMLSWNSNPSGAAGGIRYRIQLVQSTLVPADSTAWAAGTTALVAQYNSTYTTPTLVGGKTYWWRVAALRLYGGNYRVYGYSTPASFTTTGGTAVVCTPSYPTGGIAVTQTPFYAYWYVDQYTTGIKYQIRYAIGSGAVDVNGQLNHVSSVNYPLDANMPAATTTSLFMTFPTVANGSHVYWQVRVYDQSTATFGNWSTVADWIMQGPGTLVQPTLAYPTGGVTVYSTNPQLSWYLGQSYTGLTFHVYYRVSGPGAFTGPITPTPSNSTFYNLTGLTPGTSYDWYVTSYNGVTESTPSTTETFTVAGGSSSYAVATNPINDLTVYTNTPTVSWYLEGFNLGISGYNVQYKLHTDVAWTQVGGTPTVSNVYTNFVSLPSLTWGGYYDWRVGTWDGVSATYNVLGQASFYVTGGTSNPPVLSNPADASTVYSTTAYLSWYVNGTTVGIQNFILEYSPSPNFTNPLLTTTEILSATTQNKNLSGLTSGASYWWRVRAWYGGSMYADSPIYSFTVDLGSLSVVQPKIGGPNNITIATKSPVLSWYNQAQVAPTQKYELEISKSSSFAGSTIYNNVNLTKQTLSNLENTTYYWRVRGKSAGGDASYYSGVGKFTVNSGAVGVETTTEIPTAFDLKQNYPNPFNPTTTIKFSLPEASFVSLKIFDILGREIKSLVSTEMTAGSHVINWNGDDESGRKVASGNYIYRISAGKFNQARKMTLLK